MPDHWPRAAARAERHHGVLSVRDTSDLAIPSATVHSWVRSGRLRHVARRVYVVAGTPDTWHQRVTVAVASCEAWASHTTAARLWGLEGFRSPRIELLTFHGRRRARPGWTVHETRHLRGVDLDRHDGVPCTSLVRTVLDLPAVVPPSAVEKALDQACRQSPGMLDVIVQRFGQLARPGRPGTRVLRALLAERIGAGRFTQSDFETAALRLVRAVALPEPVLQHEVRDGHFVAYLDMAWPDIMLGLECDSLAHHFGKAAHEYEHRRRRRLQRLGWEIIEVTYDDVVRRPRATGRELVELYRQREVAMALVDALPGGAQGSRMT